MSYNVYPVIDNGEKCDDYTVFIDGKAAQLNVARVSAYPFNRRWPGHQRQIEQTELVNFLSMSLEGKARFKIYPKEKSEKVEIRPKSLNITPVINSDGSIGFTLDRPSYFTVEAHGRNHALHVFADEKKTYNVDKSDKNVLYFGKGEHDIGLHKMQSGETIFIDEGAVLYATIDAFCVENIKIIGRGILDNSRNKEEILFDATAENNFTAVENCKRKLTFEIDNCKNVEIDGITVRDSLAYNFNFVSCENVKVNGIKLIGDWRFNTDGVHFANCHNCVLTNSFLRNYDDNVVIRGYEENELDKLAGLDYLTDCRNITVNNLVIFSDWDVCFRIGAATLAKEICDAKISDCDVIHLSGAVFDCINCDYGDVHNFSYADINVELDDVIKRSSLQMNDSEQYSSVLQDENFCPPIIDFYILHHFEYSGKRYNPDGIIGKCHEMLFDGINVIGRQKIEFCLTGYDENHKCENITFKNIKRNGEKLKEGEITLTENGFCKNNKIIY